MPEGDTIYRAARALNQALAGHAITAFETALAPIARVNDDTPLAGRTVERVESRGKWCLIHLTGDLILTTHMRMTGSWHLYRPGERWKLPRRAMRIVLHTAVWEAVAFNVHVAEFHTAHSLARSSQIPNLGPDILSARFTIEDGIARLTAHAQTHPEAEVGVTLLNQRVLAGLGNVYKSEVAFAAGVNPWRAMDTLTPNELERLVAFAHRYMRANVADGKGDGIVTYAGNRRTTRSMDQSERLWVYRRAGKECRRCGTPILMRKQGQQARSTYWCPQCQKDLA